MPGVSKEQIAEAKRVDLLSYLQAREPGAIKKTGPNEYALKELDYFFISNGLWNWVGHMGGKSALDFLIHVRGLEFVDAVETVLDHRRTAPSLPSQPVSPKVRKPFALPKANRCGTHALNYILRRGIDSDIVYRCFYEGRFYESKPYYNCVFVGYDPQNTPRFAWLRGITSGFRQDVEGSDKRYSFALPSPDPASRHLIVGESPIDVLSVATIIKIETGQYDGYSYLSLGGVSSIALRQYLKDHPDIDTVYLCLDNDNAGLESMQIIMESVFAEKSLAGRAINIIAEPPPDVKDYNIALLAQLKENQRDAIPRRLKAAISI
ncbi:MAG: DUF3991 and toprim domain-containing protein [Oscillospiraceae bacterium]|jgi:hypothetical protein|nr:DUF3991 and toprim domain-containing protein [Oscillospiraceae bacterium]